MIKICFQNSQSVSRLYHQMLDVRKGQKRKTEYLQKIKRLNSWCSRNIVIDGEPYSFWKIIYADYGKLRKIAKLYREGEKLPEKDKEFILNTLYENKFPRKAFVEELQVTVCPYCNRNFINSTNKRTMCELDHFFDKNTYPVLAVSFYNLVPVCHACNHVKGSREMFCSPHDARCRTDELLEFNYYILGADFLHDRRQLGIELEYSAIFQNNVKVLQLEKVYQIHSDIVQECIKKAYIFNPDYLKYLYDTYEDIFESEEELYRIVFGNYMENDSYDKRPLSKLTKDIVSGLLRDYYRKEM